MTLEIDYLSIYNPVNFLSILMQVQHMVIHTIVSLKEFYHANLKKVYMYYQKDKKSTFLKVDFLLCSLIKKS
ncbi:hypothetical protein [Lysinibacillus pakistanensis]|uniref:Uncharacterized protein n=1 Tax=Lysinibacillus pakistanensis TaxID=759811 RepID=A0AAX3X464_9BACI|nr:hypothetical protein [Lysinibacillus pakistanensis]MDM5233109.1 hypothetical protein [Lysinibacillus pakistanensis]WHY48593.1 hypothetical protein QNH22_10355 [Lysinibacillus pakistanensis]WHY53606.1 hypothetical protein QNH24_10340 [Lysinibacillus pakistanensis]